MPSIDYYMPSERLRDYISVYYLVRFESPNFEDIERAALAQLRFVLTGKGTLFLPKGASEQIPGSMLIGPTSRAVTNMTSEPFTMFGMGLLPAGWGLLTNTPASDLRDDAVPADTFIPNCSAALHALQKLSDGAAMAEYADSVLEAKVVQGSSEILKFTRQVDQWLAAAVSPSLDELRAITSLSTRQLGRKVNQYYGMPPKYLSRKYRALRAARILSDGPKADTDYLQEAFYDQSHMIRELKLFTGMTPAKLGSDQSIVAPMINQRSKFGDKISPLTSQT